MGLGVLGIDHSTSGLVPVAHAPSHEGGTDPVTAAGIGAATTAQVTTAVGDHNSAAAAHGLNSVTPGSEGALKIGTDAKTSLGNAATVEAALTNLDGKNPPKRITTTANPNAGAGTAGAAGDECTDTAHGVAYRNLDGTATGWIALN